MNSKDIINREDLRDRLDNDFELFAELAEIFIEDSKKLMEEIKSAISTNNAVVLKKSAHTIKGAVANFSSEKAYNAALHLEEIGKSGDLSQAKQAFDDLIQKINSVKEAMKTILHEKKL